MIDKYDFGDLEEYFKYLRDKENLKDDEIRLLRNKIR